MPTIYRSLYPDIDIKSVDLVSYLFSNPLNTPLDRPLYIDAISGEQYTFGDVIQRTRSLSNGLRQSIGVKPNDVVAVFSPNTIDYPVVCHAIIGSRAIVAPTSAALTAIELNAQLKTSGARFIIVHSSLLETAEKAAKGTSVEKIVLIDGQTQVNGQPTCNHLASTFVPGDLLAIDPAEADRQPTFICFSSGTSGAAKGVITTHQNITSNLQQWRHNLETGLPSQRPARQSAIAFLPFSHIYGLNLFVCQCLAWGTTVVIMPKFDLELYLNCIQKYRPDELALVPPIALMLVKDPRVSKYDLSSVRKVMSAAAPLTIELASALEAKLTAISKTEVFCTQSWGLTETSPMATAIPNDRMDKRNTGLRFVDPESMKDAAVKSDGSTEPAEIWCRGPNVVSGYYNNDKASKESYHVDEDGTRWFRTGDIGTIDRDGYVAILDRIKEMIKYKGLQVIPSELEGKLVDHPDVEDAAVTGIWVEEKATELPVAFVVLSRQAKGRDQKAVIDGIHAWLDERVSNHKRLRGGIQVLSQIPKSPSGKILRRQLRDLLKSQAPKARL
ncbi:AMP-dependent synthetase/ligase [Penicillium cf. griseofulvum]|uniref:AMP-dependent synthetase/ligase n=1 Tax=Penicillium cf. griseofulvum TaxID=2972120 RepID=A0A9W9SVZ6_9EURO|nr:AMP-dependent synthetase/ligase [Penicillium cf. griseofulvum]KAJ5423241.1 AMP-dependent synthetase/ligase [Penicillium cf. griseofulvum]